MGIKGKRAVVTGAGQGIGRETALVLAQEGAVVCVSDINDSRGKETVEEICERGGTGIYIHADVGVPEEIKHLFRTAAERLGSVDILINNAAISPKVPFEDIPLEQLEQVLRVNLMGAFLCAQEAAAQMKEKRWGRIISLASMAGRFGANKSGAHYAATKAGIVGMTLSLAKTLGPYNITVNCVSPGRINTELTRVAAAESPERNLQSDTSGAYWRAVRSSLRNCISGIRAGQLCIRLLRGCAGWLYRIKRRRIKEKEAKTGGRAMEKRAKDVL